MSRSQETAAPRQPGVAATTCCRCCGAMRGVLRVNVNLARGLESKSPLVPGVPRQQVVAATRGLPSCRLQVLDVKNRRAVPGADRRGLATPIRARRPARRGRKVAGSLREPSQNFAGRCELSGALPSAPEGRTVNSQGARAPGARASRRIRIQPQRGDSYWPAFARARRRWDAADAPLGLMSLRLLLLRLMSMRLRLPPRWG